MKSSPPTIAPKELGPETREALAQLKIAARRLSVLVQSAGRSGLTYHQGTAIVELARDVVYWGNALDQVCQPDGNK